MASTTDSDGSTSDGSTSSGSLRDFLTSPVGMALVAGGLITLVIGYMVF